MGNTGTMKRMGRAGRVNVTRKDGSNRECNQLSAAALTSGCAQENKKLRQNVLDGADFVRDVSQKLKSVKPRVEILAKKRANFRLIIREKHVYAKIRRADRVGLINDELATGVEARHRARKTESEKKPEQREHRRVDRPGPFVRQLVVSFRTR